jgi:hypothetical protein
MAKLWVIKTVGIKKKGEVSSTREAFPASVSFGSSGCLFSSEKYGRGRLS